MGEYINDEDYGKWEANVKRKNRLVKMIEATDDEREKEKKQMLIKLKKKKRKYQEKREKR